jgi:hypothetical protein
MFNDLTWIPAFAGMTMLKFQRFLCVFASFADFFQT